MMGQEDNPFLFDVGPFSANMFIFRGGTFVMIVLKPPKLLLKLD